MYKKKLIEVALPLEAINKESAREKSIRHGHPSTLHLWWARRPLATCRAVLFASLVDDPSARPDEFPTEEAQEVERQRLFRLIEQLVKWENSNDEKILAAAHKEIMKSTDGNPPPVYDPFCGGGSIPLEAQRLGLEAHGSDLNPVAVMITKALIEIPPKFANQPPVNPEARKKIGRDSGWKGAAGLAEDIRYYGQWMRDEAERRIGQLYPKVKLPDEQGGGEATVIAWLWARTVKCPNPACVCEMPLVRSFALSTKKGKETWVEPIVDKENKVVRFVIKTGKGKPPEGTVNRRGAKCICCATAVPFEHVRSEGRAGRMGSSLMAIVAEGNRGRVYVGTDGEHEKIAQQAKPQQVPPDTNLPEQALGFRVQVYGMTKHRDLFTSRQLLALTTFGTLVGDVRSMVLQDIELCGPANERCLIADSMDAASVYADSVATYLSLVIDRSVDRGSTICSWDSSPKMEALRNTFARQTIQMTWDFAEGNPFSKSSGNFMNNVVWVTNVVSALQSKIKGSVNQADATNKPDATLSARKYLISTDPPYYDNIGYADLSDFFYVWLRRSIGFIYPEIFSTVLVPKTSELVATPFRFDGDKAKAQQFFEKGLEQAFVAIHRRAASDFPVTIYYAFKQSETEILNEMDDFETSGQTMSTASTGWETMLNGLLNAGFSITGTWPMRSELSNRMVASGTNALASSIVLVCRPRPSDAPSVTRKEFLSALRRELSPALKELQQGSIAPVDLAQATIGPGMAVFSRYTAVLEANGEAMPVRTALQIINQELDEWLKGQEGILDTDTRFCVTWYETFGMAEAAFGEANTLAQAKNTVVQRLDDTGLLSASKGKVRLLSRNELSDKWSPSHSSPIWLCTQYLVRALAEGGETKAAELANKMGGHLADAARSLAYRLYAVAERKGWTEDALAYNSLAASWSDVQTKAAEAAGRPKIMDELF